VSLALRWRELRFQHCFSANFAIRPFASAQEWISDFMSNRSA
jgi:hypothetical protein